MNEKLSISVLEFDYHPEVLRNTCRILENTPLKANILTSKKIWKKTNIYQEHIPQNISIHIFNPDKQSFSNFIKAHNAILQKVDIVMFNTVASRFRFFSKLKLAPITILRIHNANAYFNSILISYKPRFTPFFIWKDCSHFIRNTVLKLNWYYKSQLLDKIDYFAFPNKTIERFAVENLSLNKYNHVSLPFVYTSDIDMSNTKNKPPNSVTVTVPGKIDKRKRNYSLLIRSLEQLIPSIQNDGFTLRLILLGKSNTSYGRRVIKKIRKLECSHFTLISFDKFINQERFSKFIQETDFFILPINIKTRYTIFDESYGYTKISGSINDMIHFKKPALITSEYPLDENLKEISDTFDNETELSEKTREWCLHKKFNTLDIDKHLKKYDIEEIRKVYLQIFQDLLLSKETKK